MIDYTGGHYSLGWWFGWPTIAILALVCIGTIALLVMCRDGDDVIPVLAVGWIPWAFLVFALVCMYPFSNDFHTWYPVNGTVESTSHRLISDGDKGMSERYVIKFKESGTLYGCDDTRCTLATEGKRINLKCKKEFVWQSRPGWACNYDQEN